MDVILDLHGQGIFLTLMCAYLALRNRLGVGIPPVSDCTISSEFKNANFILISESATRYSFCQLGSKVGY